MAPLGSVKPPEEPNAFPVPSRFAHIRNCMLISASRSLVSPPVGGITINSPCCVAFDSQITIDLAEIEQLFIG